MKHWQLINEESGIVADVLLVDKTGTLTLGQPQVTDVISLNGLSRTEVLSIAASDRKSVV